MCKKHILLVVLFTFLIGLVGCEPSVKINITFFDDSKKVYIIISESMNHYGFVTDNDKDKIKLYLETYANTNDQNEKQIYNTMSDSPAKTPKSFQLSRINSYEC